MLREDLGLSVEADFRRWELVVNAYWSPNLGWPRALAAGASSREQEGGFTHSLATGAGQQPARLYWGRFGRTINDPSPTSYASRVPGAVT